MAAVGRPVAHTDRRVLDGLAGRRVPSHPCRPLPHLEDTETGQTDFVALLQMACGQRYQIAEHGLCVLLRDVMAVCQRSGRGA